MASFVRWLVAITSTLATFGVCLWVFRFISFSWMPHAVADRWVVAAAFATVAATAVGAATAWWANREHEKPTPSPVQPADAGISISEQTVTSPEGPVFGSHGDYRGAIFNIKSKKAAPLNSSRGQASELEDTIAELPKLPGGEATIIPFPRGKAGRPSPTEQTRSWDDLAEILQQTTLQSADWVSLADSSEELRNELAAERAPDPNLPDSVPGLITRLRELLNIISSPVSPDSFGSMLVEARQLRDLLVQYLKLRKE